MSNPPQKFLVIPPNMVTPWGYSIRFGVFHEDNRIALAQPVTFVTQEAGGAGMHTEPMLTDISEQGLQTLMDSLWNVGIRPSDIGTPGHLAATQAHLEDMRKIVQQVLPITLTPILKS